MNFSIVIWLLSNSTGARRIHVNPNVNSRNTGRNACVVRSVKDFVAPYTKKLDPTCFMHSVHLLSPSGSVVDFLYATAVSIQLKSSHLAQFRGKK